MMLFPSNKSSVFDNIEEEDSILLTRNIAYKIFANIIILLGILGSLLTILILKSNKVFKGVTYTYFLTLALADLLSLVFSISTIVHFLHPMTSSYVTAFWYAHLESITINSAMGTSTLIVVCITFDRFISVCRPYQYKSIHTYKYCYSGIVASILISICVWIPSSFLKRPTKDTECKTFYFDRTQDLNSTYWVSCQVLNPTDHKWYIVYAWAREVIVLFIPLFIIIVLNILILKKFLDRRKVHVTNGTFKAVQVSRSQNSSEDLILVNLLKAIIISFLVTLLPAGIFNAAYNYKLSIGIHYEIFRAIANDLQLVNHACNFYLYILLSKSIRETIPAFARNSFRTLGFHWCLKLDKTIRQTNRFDIENSADSANSLKTSCIKDQMRRSSNISNVLHNTSPTTDSFHRAKSLPTIVEVHRSQSSPDLKSQLR